MDLGIDSLVGLFAPHICIVCAREGAVMCDMCLQSAGEPIVPRCAGCKALSDDYKTCSACRSWLDVYAVYAATPYDRIYEQLVRHYKFDVQRSAVLPMVRLMSEVEAHFPAEFVVCYMPTAPSRIRQRGFDHAHGYWPRTTPGSWGQNHTSYWPATPTIGN